MENIKRKMEYPDGVRRIVDIYRSHNKEISLVGGCIRDYLMGMTPHDYDFTTNALPEESIQFAKEEGLNYLTTGLKHGTISIICDKEIYEITTYRKDVNIKNHRYAEVKFIEGIKEDLSRRDFTINAIAYDCINEIFIDYFNGIKDIDSKTIRCVGNPSERFCEDYLRVLRGYRFSLKYDGFTIEKSTQEAMIHCLKTNCLHYISNERIHNEIIQIFASPYLCENKIYKLYTLFMSIFNITKCMNYGWMARSIENLNNIVSCSIGEIDDKNYSDTANQESLFANVTFITPKQFQQNLYLTRIAILVLTMYAERSDSNLITSLSDVQPAIDKLTELRFSKQEVLFIKKMLVGYITFDKSINKNSIIKVIQCIGREYAEYLFIILNSVGELSYRSFISISRIMKVLKDTKEPLFVCELVVDGKFIMNKVKCESGPKVKEWLELILENINDNNISNDIQSIENFITNHLSNL